MATTSSSPSTDRIRGRVAAEDVIDPNTGEVIVHVNEMIDHDIANRICAAGIKEVTVRSVLTCQSPSGVCARCYGANMTNGKLVDVGEAVGIKCRAVPSASPAPS